MFKQAELEMDDEDDDSEDFNDVFGIVSVLNMTEKKVGVYNVHVAL